jgi:hypothetical protein
MQRDEAIRQRDIVMMQRNGAIVGGSIAQRQRNLALVDSNNAKSALMTNDQMHRQHENNLEYQLQSK